MKKLPVISGHKCVRVLEKIGFTIRVQEGSHIIMVCETPKIRVSVPNHKELDKGTLRSIIRRAGLTVEDFINLL